MNRVEELLLLLAPGALLYYHTNEGEHVFSAEGALDGYLEVLRLTDQEFGVLINHEPGSTLRLA